MQLKLFQLGFVSWMKNCGRREKLSPRRAVDTYFPFSEHECAGVVGASSLASSNGSSPRRADGRKGGESHFSESCTTFGSSPLPPSSRPSFHAASHRHKHAPVPTCLHPPPAAPQISFPTTGSCPKQSSPGSPAVGTWLVWELPLPRSWGNIPVSPAPPLPPCQQGAGGQACVQEHN